jgi:hypothetical protein
MGDRSNIVIQQSNGDRVYLYGHWLGSSAIGVVQGVLERHERWSDESYLARMLFNEMTSEDPDSSTGFGISANYMPDNEHPLIVLTPETKEVHLESVSWTQDSGQVLTKMTRTITMQEFLDIRRDNKYENVLDNYSYELLAESMGLLEEVEV